MKNLFLLAVLLFSFNAVSQNKKNEKAVIKTTIYCDHCKACETCGKAFHDNLYAIKGLKMYELDEEAETITVYYDGRKTNLGTIRSEISKMGYDADDIKADEAGYEKLDGCCKKA